jgi:hypothetical protein
MIRKLMATIASSAILLLGALVGLEALGLIFRVDPPQLRIASIRTGLDDPEALAAALLWQQQEADSAEARRKAEDELRRFEAARQDPAGQAREEERRLADALRWAERYRQRQAEVRLTPARVAALHQPQAVAKPPEAAEPAGQPQPPPQPIRDVKLVAATEPLAPPRAAARPSSARPGPAGAHRARAGRAAGPGCPLLGWLGAASWR